MAVSVRERPQGVILGDCVTATIDEDYAGYATINKLSHGLYEGQFVYVTSDIEDYNGFWSVHVVDGHHFFLEQYPGGPYVAFKVNADITYCPAESTHGWSCVHLPIVYKLASNRWPVNTADSTTNISSTADVNGYLDIITFGAIKTGMEVLDYVKISGAADEDVNGVWQVVAVTSDSHVVINAVYTSTSLTGATVQFYYNNYHVRVKVFSGLPAAHNLVAYKPFEELAVLKFIPDSDGTIKFSINEILKSHIITRNNLQLATLPTNLDFFTGFYISYSECFDLSDGEDITVSVGSYTQDSFEGWAANSKLPFKNQYAGFLSEYAMREDGKFLTLFDTPVIFPSTDDHEYYQDISFIVDADGTGLKLRQKYYTEGVLQTTSDKAVTTYDRGIYRVKLDEPLCAYDQVKISLLQTAEFPTLSEWESLTDSNPAWTEGSAPSVTLTGIGQLSEHLSVPVQGFAAGTVNFDYALNRSNDNITLQFRFYRGTSIVGSATLSLGASTGAITGSSSVVLSDTPTRAVIFASNALGISSTLTVTSLDVTDNVYTQVSEEKTFDVDCECANQELRLTWLNYLGGFEYWSFTAQKEHQVDIKGSESTKTNIFPNWPKSYGSYADTIEKETLRLSQNKQVVRSQYLTLGQLQAIKYIKTSPLVQIITSRSDKCTVKVDTDSFKVYDEGEKLFSISFNITYTDEIPSQSV